MTSIIIVIIILVIIGTMTKNYKKQQRIRGSRYHKRRQPIAPGSALLKREYRRQPIPFWMKQEVFIRDQGRCQHCGITEQEVRMLTGHPMEYDHITPYSWGGPTRVDNLQLLCPNCNQLKSNRYSG